MCYQFRKTFRHYDQNGNVHQFEINNHIDNEFEQQQPEMNFSWSNLSGNKDNIK